MSKVYGFRCPCIDCERRVIGCHGNCTAYKEWTDKGIETGNKDFFMTPAHKNKIVQKIRHRAKRGKQ